MHSDIGIIFDLDGKYYKKYVEWEQENIVICFGLGETEQGYLRHRIEHGNVVYGFKQSIQGQEVDEKLASILMQSKSRRIYQLTQMEEVLFGEEEIEEIADFYDYQSLKKFCNMREKLIKLDSDINHKIINNIDKYYIEKITI